MRYLLLYFCFFSSFITAVSSSSQEKERGKDETVITIDPDSLPKNAIVEKRKRECVLSAACCAVLAAPLTYRLVLSLVGRISEE
jgi:hypothetical protein